MKLTNRNPHAIKTTCQSLEVAQPLTTRQILEPFGLLEGHPWAETAASDLTTYYACLHGVAQPEQPRKILEIGTAFGMSAAAFLTASPGIELFISLDLGIYGGLLGSQKNNIDFSRSHIHDWCGRHHVDTSRVRFYRANTQPPGQGDNDNQGLDAPRWCLLPEVVRLLQEHQFDIVFVDGKHTDDGLLNDMKTFWPFLKPDGLMICDDLHHPDEYAGSFSWVGHTWQSFHRFVEERAGEIAEHVLWNFPQVPPDGKMGLRPFGLVRKSAASFPAVKSPEFEMFDSEGALAINRARQDHLASLGLDLAGRSVLEVGAGVGWHTGFFERLGCSVLTTDARPDNVAETLRRFPYRAGRVQVADLSVSGTHARFGDFDIVYCYGTLYHLRDPALCLADLAHRCRGLLLLETCVHPSDNGQLNLEAERASNPNQSFQGMGCRPGRDWVIQELQKHFPHVYVSATQPDYPDFALNWPAPAQSGVLFRAVFVASHHPLNLPSLLKQLPANQKWLQSVLGTQVLPAGSAVAAVPGQELGLTGKPTIPVIQNPPLYPEADESQEKGEDLRAMLRQAAGRSAPVTPEEVTAADALIQAMLGSPNAAEFIAQYRDSFPDVLAPLLAYRVRLAQADGETLLAEVLQLVLTNLGGKPACKPVPANLKVQPDAEFSVLRARLGRLLHLPAPLAEADLVAAQVALSQILEQPEILKSDQAQTAQLPPATVPLLLHHWVEACATGDDGIITALERMYGELTVCTQPQTSSTVCVAAQGQAHPESVAPDPAVPPLTGLMARKTMAGATQGPHPVGHPQAPEPSRLKQVVAIDPKWSYDIYQSYYMDRSRFRLKAGVVLVEPASMNVILQINWHGLKGAEVNSAKRLAAVWGDSVVFGIQEGWVEGISSKFPGYQFLNGGIEGASLDIILENAYEVNSKLEIPHNIVFPGWHTRMQPNRVEALLRGAASRLPGFALCTVPISISRRLAGIDLTPYFSSSDQPNAGLDYYFMGNIPYSIANAQQAVREFEEQNRVVRALARELGLPLVDLYQNFYVDDLAHFRDYFFDIGHPRTEAFPLLQAAFYEALKVWLPPATL